MYERGSLQSGPSITISEHGQEPSRHVDFIKTASAFFWSLSFKSHSPEVESICI